MRLCTVCFPSSAASVHTIFGSLWRCSRCALFGGRAQGVWYCNHVCVYGRRGCHQSSHRSLVELSSATPVCAEDDRNAAAPRSSAAQKPAAFSSTSECDVDTNNSSHRGVSAAILLSLNHTQRLLRRLPVGTSHSLFHYNELPSNIGDKMPAVVQQWRQGQQPSPPQRRRPQPHPNREEHTAGPTVPIAASTPGESVFPLADKTSVDNRTVRVSSSTDYWQLLTLSQPRLTASEATIFALFRAAQKERRLARMQWRNKRQEGLCTGVCEGRLDCSAEDALPSLTDPLLHLHDLEEPCLLVPDTRGACVSLGLTVDWDSTTNTTTNPKCTEASVASAAGSPPQPYLDVGRAARASVAPDTTVMDAFRLGIVSTCTDYRTDYSNLPLHYVLGVPTALLDILRSDPSIVGHAHPSEHSSTDAGGNGSHPERFLSQVPEDLSRWLVFDTATSQVLLRRHEAPRTGETWATSTRMSILEAQVFLAHTYSFDARSAYEAAVAQAQMSGQRSLSHTTSSASTGEAAPPTLRTPTTPLYTLFFFTVVRGEVTGSSHVSPIVAGALYPTCFFSYMSEVPTTQELAAKRMATSAQQLRFDHSAGLASSTPSSSVTVYGASDSSSFFVPLSGKRLRACVAGSSPSAAHLWTTQVQGRKLKPITGSATVPSSSSSRRHAEQKTVEYSPGGRSSTPKDLRDTNLSPQRIVHQKIRDIFRIWREVVAARVASPPLCAATGAMESRGDSSRSRPSPLASRELQRAAASRHHPGHSGQGGQALGSVPWSTAVRQELREDGRRSQLEEQLDAESLGMISDREAFSQRLISGSRFGRVAIAVAVPLLITIPKAVTGATVFPCPPPVAHQGGDVGGAGAGLHATVRVTDAPLADALWRVLYTPEAIASAPIGVFPAPAAMTAEAAVRCVLPTAEDRLMLARERVFLPFVLRQPRWVLPGIGSLDALSSSFSSPNSGTGSSPEAAVKPNGLSTGRVCPCLWRLDELEQLCGWRHPPFSLRAAFGSFSGLLIHELYITLGQRTSAMHSGWISAQSVSASSWSGQYAPLSPVVLFNDVAYVELVLLPAMKRYAAHTCTRVGGSLCVYRSPWGVSPSEARGELEVDLAVEKNPSSSSVSRVSPQCCLSRMSYPGSAADARWEPAVEVALHHLQLSAWLQRLQRTPRRFLKQWLAACYNSTSLSAASDAAVRRGTGGVPAACLVFFVGSCSNRLAQAVSASSPTSHVDADDVDLGDCSAVAASFEVIEDAIERLLSLTPEQIIVVPLLDFVVWGALCSDFSTASLQHLAHTVDSCRAMLEPSADGVAAVKYCMRYPRKLCCEGGRGMTVALLR